MEPRSLNQPRSRTENALGKGLRASAAAIATAIALLAGRTHAAEPMTLDQVLDLARQRSPEILAARQDLVVARSRLEKAR